jgi:hypothetical protein
MQKIKIQEIPFTTPKGKVLSGVEKIVACPMALCNVNVKKNCGKCMAKEKINYKEKFILCKYGEDK